MIGLLSLMLLDAAAGPAPSAAPKQSPAAEAIALYRAEHDPPAAPKPCRQARGEEIVVCGSADGRSPYRLPLPDETGSRAGPRQATGDIPRAGIGGSPVQMAPGVGLTLTLRGGEKPAITPTGERP